MNQNNDQNFINRLKRHPKLRERMEVLLNVVENTAGDCTKADDAEHYAIEELRKMGNDALRCFTPRSHAPSGNAYARKGVLSVRCKSVPE